MINRGVSVLGIPAFSDLFDVVMPIVIRTVRSTLSPSKELRSHFLPALVLLFFCWVGIRSPLEPVREPIYISLLRYEPFPGFEQEVRPEGNPYEFHGFFSERES